jgi:hypothetical protein
VVSEGGWYPDPDPAAGPGSVRWWDGTSWTGETRAPLAAPPPRPGPSSRAKVLIGAGVVAVLAIAVGVVAVAGNGGGSLVAARTGSATPSSGAPSTAAPTPAQPSPSATPKARPSPKRNLPPVPGCPSAFAGPAPRLGPVTIPGHPSSPRVYDRASGVSYDSPGEPWLPFRIGPWATKGAGATFNFGYLLVAATGTPNGDYYATALSGTVATTSGAGASCLAEEVAADVRIAFYPEPNTRRNLSAKAVVVDGHAGYVVHFQLGINAPGYGVRSEQVSVLVINNGRPRLPVLYTSIPDTVHNYNYVADQTFASVRLL